MKLCKLTSGTGVLWFAALAFTAQVPAQDNPHPKYHQYKLTQVGTFGGPNSALANGPGGMIEKSLNHEGATVGGADLNIADPFYPNCFGFCFVIHALTFQDGTLTDLGALGASTNSSVSYDLNDNGVVVGVSENGAIDPATGYPEYHAAVWRDGQIQDLGTFGGTVSQAFAVNNRGQVVGVAANSVPDQYTNDIGPCTPINCWTVTTQQRAFLWQGAGLQDLGTLGGNDAVALYVNNRGQVAGVSFTNTTPNPTTGFPTQDGFLWDRGRMIDLGTLGGTVSRVFRLNNRGQVVGRSNLAGDQDWHGFLWDRGVLTDVGTLGGSSSAAYAIAESGVVAGTSYIAGDQTLHAFLWDHGSMTDLGTVAGDARSYSNAVNSAATVVGASCAATDCSTQRASVSEKGGSMVDLNALVSPPSDLYLLSAWAIADNGEILAQGQLANGDFRIAVLTPTGNCDNSCEQRIADGQNHAAAAVAAHRPAKLSAFGKPADYVRNRLSGALPALRSAGLPVR